MTRLLAFDPGGEPRGPNSKSATGWSLWFYDAITPLRPIEHGQIKGNEHVFIAWYWANIERLAPDEIVAERFTLDGRTMFPDITPKAIEGALFSANYGVRPITLQQNVMKAHLTDARAKELGLWWPGQPHAIDSMRHAFAYLKLARHKPTIRMLTPDRRGSAAA